MVILVNTLKNTTPTFALWDFILLLVLILIAGAASGIMDLISFHWHKTPDWIKSRSGWWKPSESWRNKWKNGDPNQGEKFIGSSRWFVAVSDAWHAFKSIMIISTASIFALIMSKFDLIAKNKKRIIRFIIYFIIFRLLYYIGFELFYS